MPELSIDELELDTRNVTLLGRLGIKTADQICRLSSSELLRNANYGKVSLRILKQALAHHGLSLADVQMNRPLESVTEGSLVAAINRLALAIEKLCDRPGGITNV